MRLIWWHTSAPTYQMNYVNMRPNSVDMQHDQDMRDIYVYLQHNYMYVNMQISYVNMRFVLCCMWT